MCSRENSSLQKGMNYSLGGNYSVILMSQRTNAPYNDSVSADGKTLIYEGHDVPKTSTNQTPKLTNQQEFHKSGSLTENGKFFKAAQDFKNKIRSAETINVYEKIKPGIWAFNGTFSLVDAWTEHDGHREVFKFKLILGVENRTNTTQEYNPNPGRIIPTQVKLEVWKRDKGRCVLCGSENNLHFDHIIPFSKGGSSTTAQNIQLLCAKHNLEKHDKIE